MAGKGVLVTGGTSGIGLATARRFLAEGARVFVCADDAAAVDATVASLGVGGGYCDVSRSEEVGSMVAAADAWLGGIDVLVNNAGVAQRSPFLDITAASFDRVVAVNLRGAFLVAQAVARGMVERGRGGVILNMSSTNGLGGEEDYAHYNATKAGVLLLTRTMAVELGTHRIRVNALCPGYIRTPLNAAIAAGSGDDFVGAYIRDRIPLARAGSAEDVAGAYAFLASDDAAFVTGTELVIDGGQLAVM
ncbi:glucose 1-dehydrogenase [Jiangella ureilytica]|uniref:Glucose 1-dehydrogenase n=1 Tax=Jiangella ureilytica TaxID=2530374 RepID=A0A4V6PB09_9ACTN|nr:glucose 1-dehydrogenase [Jiangella ureilytica]